MTKTSSIEITESQLKESDSNGNLSSLLGDNSKLAERIEQGKIGAEGLLSMNISLPKMAARVTDRVIHPPFVGRLTPASSGIMGLGKMQSQLTKLIRKESSKETLGEVNNSLQASESSGDTTSNQNSEMLPGDVTRAFSTGSFDGIAGGFEGLLSAGGGSPDVIIQGLPAWRALIDIHLCPWHGPGIVIKGSQTVFINGFPATRILDVVVEVVPNVIIQGSPTVLIGD